MILTLKNIKHSPSLSQETEAFTADIYVDGKKAGYCENHGQGGQTDIRPYTLEAQMDAYAATLPDAVTAYGTFKQTADSLVDDLLSAHLTAKEAKRLERDFERSFTTRIMVVAADGSVRMSKKLPEAQVQVAVTAHRARYEVGGARLLNLLPKAEARVYWMKGVGA